MRVKIVVVGCLILVIGIILTIYYQQSIITQSQLLVMSSPYPGNPLYKVMEQLNQMFYTSVAILFIGLTVTIVGIVKKA